MKKPNFIVIYCDDLGYGDLGCYGSEAIRTPHLDRLAAEGVRFTDWYSNSPVCSPSRASLLTGKYPAHAGVNEILGGNRGTHGLPGSETTIAAALQSAGYRTALFGKWHLGTAPGYHPNDHGFEEFFGFLAGCVDYYSHIFYWGQGDGSNPVHDLWHNRQEVWHNGAYLTDLITEKATGYINACNARNAQVASESEEPFFMYVAYNAPHYPMHAPAHYLDRYPELPPDRRIMAAMISAVDDGVGAIMEALRQTGQADNTVLFFSSDNGPSVESRNFLDGTEDRYYGGSAGIFRGHKASLFDGGIREPAILHYPAGVRGGQVRHEPCMMMDVFPTFLELAGLAGWADSIGSEAAGEQGVLELDGQSIVPLLRGEAADSERQLFWSYHNQAAVREGHWKLVLNGMLDMDRAVDEVAHLSDLSADPGERVNLAAAYPDIADRLAHDLQQWLEQTQSR